MLSLESNLLRFGDTIVLALSTCSFSDGGSEFLQFIPAAVAAMAPPPSAALITIRGLLTFIVPFGIKAELGPGIEPKFRGTAAND